MEQNEKTFQISVTFNQGLEALTLNVTPQENQSLQEQELEFIVKRYEDHLSTVITNTNHSWKQIKGEMDQDQINTIGAAIDAHYSKDLEN